jgi:DtxR family Mn-dependent transcriptional regulator
MERPGVESTRLSPAVENYLKVVRELQQDQDVAAVGEVAERLGVTPASVTLMFRSLAEKGLVRYVPYQGATLTRAGKGAALRVLRRHRLVERYLVDELGLTWDEVHAEAERWEHVLSPKVEARIASLLGDPGTDPHGAPIPSTQGKMEETEAQRLDQIQPDETAWIGEIYDRDAELLRYLDSLGIKPGVKVFCQSREPYGGSLSLKLNDSSITLGLEAARRIKTHPGPPTLPPHPSGSSQEGD